MNIDIIGGGTISHVRNHLALTAPAYGTTAIKILSICDSLPAIWKNYNARIYLTKMADPRLSSLETNDDIENLVDKLIANPDTKIIFFNVALVDYDGAITNVVSCDDSVDYNYLTHSGKYETRLKTSEGNQKMTLTPAKKIISKIRKERKDIFLVGLQNNLWVD